MGTQKGVKLTKSKIEQTKLGGKLWDSEVSGFHVVTTPSGKRSYKFQYRTLEGAQGKLTIGSFPSMTVDEARKIVRQHRVEVDKGGHPSLMRKQSRKQSTLADFVSYYCEEYGPQKGLQPSTVRDAERVLCRYALPKYGRCKVTDLRPRDVMEMVAEARDAGSVAQANRLRAALSKVFNLAMRDIEGMNINPASKVEKYPENIRTARLSSEEVRRLLNACDDYPDQEVSNAFRLLLFTGARKNEVLKADWSQFDLQSGIWTKPAGHVKTNRTHILSLEPETIALLEQMYAVRRSDFLFPGGVEGKARYDLKGPWKTIRDAAGLQQYRIHDLRRTLASFMISTNSDIATVGRALGHTQAQTTQRYASMFPSVQREGTARAVRAMLKSEIA